MKFLKKFENHSAYEAAESGLILPNVSLCVQENDVYYKPYVPVETRLVCKYNVEDTSEETTLFNMGDFIAMEIDGVEQSGIVRYYQFDTIGEHTVKYTLTNPTIISRDQGAFSECYSLTSIVIPNGVTSIGYGDFFNCYGLTSVTIPDSVTSIDDNAFYYCNSLTSVNIPSGVTTIEDQVFIGCSSLASIDIPNSVTSIGTSAFEGCSSLPSINLPNGVTIYCNAFCGCNGLDTASRNAIRAIEPCAFYCD